MNIRPQASQTWLTVILSGNLQAQRVEDKAFEVSVHYNTQVGGWRITTGTEPPNDVENAYRSDGWDFH